MPDQMPRQPSGVARFHHDHTVLYLQAAQPSLLHKMQWFLWTFLRSIKMIILGKRQIRNACGNLSGLSWLSNSIFTWVNCTKRAYVMDFPPKFYTSNTSWTPHFLVILSSWFCALGCRLRVTYSFLIFRFLGRVVCKYFYESLCLDTEALCFEWGPCRLCAVLHS